MKKTTSNSTCVITALLFGVMIIGLGACAGGETPEVQAMKARLKQIDDERATIEKNLATFDTLDR